MAGECRCERCKYYARFETPYHYEYREYPDGITVYGCCGKDAARSFSLYPVYLPDGGVCKAFKKKSGIKAETIPQEGQISMEEAMRG